jgi:hypothetical protein
MVEESAAHLPWTDSCSSAILRRVTHAHTRDQLTAENGDRLHVRLGVKALFHTYVRPKRYILCLVHVRHDVVLDYFLELVPVLAILDSARVAVAAVPVAAVACRLPPPSVPPLSSECGSRGARRGPSPATAI